MRFVADDTTDLGIEIEERIIGKGPQEHVVEILPGQPILQRKKQFVPDAFVLLPSIDINRIQFGVVLVLILQMLMPRQTAADIADDATRSEERRVGKEGRSRWS